jgi:uncharacterized OsmC-like protein
LEVKAEAVKSEEVGTVTEATLDVVVKAGVPEDRIRRLHDLTVKGCPVGKLFENAGVRIVYRVRAEGE